MNDSALSLAAAADKLGHALVEVRRRAVQSLDFKLRNGLVSIEGLSQEATVLKGLLGCLEHSDNGIQTDAAVLMLVARVAAAPFTAKQLLHLGAERLLQELQIQRSTELQPLITAALSALLSAPNLAGTLPSTPAISAAPPGWAAVGGSAAGHRASGTAHLALGEGQRVTIPLPWGASGQAHGSIQEGRGTASGLTTPFTWSPQRAYTPSAHTQRQEGPDHYHSHQHSSQDYAGVRTSQTQHTFSASQRVQVPASATGTPAPLTGGARAALAAQRAARQRESAEARALGPSTERDWLLRPVALGQADDQDLFELSLRLQYVDDPRVVLPALLQLHGRALVDLPAEAVAARHGIVDHLLLLVTSSQSPRDLVDLAAQCLLRIVCQLKRALCLATDTAYQAASSASSSSASSAVGTAEHGSSPAGQDTSSSPTRQHADPAAAAREQPPQMLLPHALPGAPGTAGATASSSMDAGLALGESKELLNLSHLAYLVALQAFQALSDPARVYLVSPLLEELVPLLLHGRDGPLAVTREHDKFKWAQLLQVLAQALVTNLSIARAEGPAILHAYAPGPDGHGSPLPPLLNAPVAAMLSLSAGLLSGLPRELWTPEVVPPAMTDALAAVARDEVLCGLLPGLRSAVLPVLGVLRADVTALLDVAAAGEAALSAAEVLVRQLPLLREGAVAPSQWLHQLQAALPALHLPGQEQLMEMVVQGLALVCSSRGGAGAGGQGLVRESVALAAGAVGGGGAGAEVQWVSEAEGVFLALLSHQRLDVALACYGLVEGLAGEASKQRGHPLLQLLSRQAILEHLVVLGLADERTRRQVARILTHLMADPDCQQCILPWSVWVQMYSPDPQVGVLAASLAAATRNAAARQQAPSLDWEQLQQLLPELFHSDADRRRAAAQQLSDALYFSGAPVAASGEPHAQDPFRVVLDNGARDDLLVPAASWRAHGPPAAHGGGAGGGGGSLLSRGFRPADVSNLLAILANGSLAPELRRSAAEQLLALAGEAQLRDVMLEEANMRTIACVAALRDPSTGAALTASQAGALAAQGLLPPTPDLLSTLDVQLPLAAINLLYVLAAHSHRARAWLVSEPERHGPGRGSLSGHTDGAGSGGGGGGGLELLVGGVLPLVFHTMVTVRRAVARLLAAVCLGYHADRWSGWGHVSGVACMEQQLQQQQSGVGGGSMAGAGGVVRLPSAFKRCFMLPCRAMWVELPPAAGQREPAAAALQGKPMLQDLVLEQRELVILLVQERQALRAVGGDLGRLLAAMNDNPDSVKLPHAATHSLAASIRSAWAPAAVPHCLVLVRAATSHTQCAAALQGVQAACCSMQGLEALAASDWQVHLEHLLDTCPATHEDRAVWSELLGPVRRAVASGAMTQPQLLQLALYMQQSGCRLLSQPDAGTDPAPHPVALAGSAALGEHAGQQASLVACTQAVLATLIEIVRAARVQLPAHAALQVLSGLCPTQLLHTLATSYLGSPAAGYGCRALAAQLLLEVAAALGARDGPTGRQETQAVLDLADPGLQEALLACLRALLCHVVSGAPAAAGGTTSSAVAGRASTSSLGGAAAGRESQGGGFLGKGLLRLAMHCLMHLTVLLPVRTWSEAWVQLSGSYWVSRLLRDRDAVLRALAAELLARLMQPGAEGSQAMVAQGWPDAVRTMSKLAQDRGSCYALRTAALRVLGCCMAQEAPPGGHAAPFSPDAAPPSLPRRQLFASASGLPPSVAVLQDRALWERLSSMLREQDAPSGFLAAALGLLLQGLLLDGERSAGVLAQPGLLGRLMQMLEPGWVQLAAWQGASGDRGAVLAVLGGVAQGREGRRDAGGGSPQRGGRHQHEVVGGRQGHSRAHLGWCDPTAALAVESRPGLDMHLQPAAAAPSPAAEPVGARHLQHALRCTSLLCQALAHTQQDPPLLQLGLLGHSPAQVVTAVLRAFAHLAAAVTTPEDERTAPAGWHQEDIAVKGLRLQALEHAAAAGNALLQQLSAEEALEALAPLEASLSGAGGPGPLLCLCAAVGLSPVAPPALRLAVVCLAASLLAHETVAARLLHIPDTDSEHLLPSTGQEVGAGLCSSFLSLLPDEAFRVVSPATAATAWPPPSAPRSQNPHPTPGIASPLAHRASTLRGSYASALGGAARLQDALLHPGGALTHGGEQQGDLQQQLLGPRAFGSCELCVIVGLRNLLAYSSGAKLAAIQAGFHHLLMRCCSEAAAAMAAAAAAPGAGERKGASTAGPLTTPSAKLAAVKRLARRAPSAAASAVQTPAGAGSGHQQRAAGGAGAASVRSSTSQLPNPTFGPTPAAASPQPPTRGGGGGVGGTAAAHGQAQAERKAAAQQAARLVEQKAVASLSLLKHLAHGSPVARQLLTRDGLVGALRSLWPHAAAATWGPLLHELLGLLANLLPDCAEAKARVALEGAAAGEAGAGGAAGGGAAAGAGGGSLLGGLQAVLFGASRLEAPTFRLLCGVLLALAASEDGAGLLLRGSFLASCHKALQDMANSNASGSAAGGGPGAGGQARLGRDLQRQAVLLQVLTNLAAWPEGHRALLKSGAAPGLLELLARTLSSTEGTAAAAAAATVAATASDARQHQGQQDQGAHQQPHVQQLMHQLGLRNACLALLRNLCFASEAKSHLLAHPGVLPALVAAAEGVGDNPAGAAFAASGLWALAYQGEKVKATLRRVPSAPQRLVAAHATCRFQETRVAGQLQHQHPHDRQPSSTAVQPAGTPNGVEVGLGLAAAVGFVAPGGQQRGAANSTLLMDEGVRGPGEALQQRLLWLQRAGMQLGGLLEALQATAAGRGAEEDREEHGWFGTHAGAVVGAVSPLMVRARAGWRPDRSPVRDQGGGGGGAPRVLWSPA